jgi:hypothetical protein
VALILSKEQLHRLLKVDGVLQLYPSHTEEGSPRYTHACVGEPFARIHVGQNGQSGDIEYYGHVLPAVRIAPYIKKIDALEPVDFYPSYFYTDLEHMMFGKLQQFMLPGDGTDEKIDAMFYLDLQNNNISIVSDLVQQTGFNTDKLKTYMAAHNLTTVTLFNALREKWL